MMDCAVLITTHNRQDYFERIAKYYADFSIKVYLYDSTSDSYNNKLPKNIIYKHAPGESFFIKLQRGAEEIGKNYIVAVGDDDFVLKSAIQQGYEFLKSSSRYKVATGRFLQFNKDFDGYFQDRYPYMFLYWTKINNKFEQDRKRRMTNSLSYYYQFIWAIHTKENLLEAVKALNSCELSGRLNWLEPLFTAIASYHGGIKVFEDIWGIREELDVEAVTKNRISNLHSEYIGNIQKAKVKVPELFQQEFAEISNKLDKKYFDGFTKLMSDNYGINKKATPFLEELKSLYLGSDKNLKISSFSKNYQFQEIEKVNDLLLKEQAKAKK